MWQQETHPVLTWIKISPVGLVLSCCFGTISLIEFVICTEASQSDKNKGLCLDFLTATYHQTKLDKRSLYQIKYLSGF